MNLCLAKSPLFLQNSCVVHVMQFYLQQSIIPQCDGLFRSSPSSHLLRFLKVLSVFANVSSSFRSLILHVAEYALSNTKYSIRFTKYENSLSRLFQKLFSGSHFDVKVILDKDNIFSLAHVKCSSLRLRINNIDDLLLEEFFNVNNFNSLTNFDVNYYPSLSFINLLSTYLPNLQFLKIIDCELEEYEIDFPVAFSKLLGLELVNFSQCNVQHLINLQHLNVKGGYNYIESNTVKGIDCLQLLITLELENVSVDADLDPRVNLQYARFSRLDVTSVGHLFSNLSIYEHCCLNLYCIGELFQVQLPFLSTSLITMSPNDFLSSLTASYNGHRAEQVGRDVFDLILSSKLLRLALSTVNFKSPSSLPCLFISSLKICYVEARVAIELIKASPFVTLLELCSIHVSTTLESDENLCLNYLKSLTLANCEFDFSSKFAVFPRLTSLRFSDKDFNLSELTHKFPNLVNLKLDNVCLINPTLNPNHTIEKVVIERCIVIPSSNFLCPFKNLKELSINVLTKQTVNSFFIPETVKYLHCIGHFSFLKPLLSSLNLYVVSGELHEMKKTANAARDWLSDYHRKRPHMISSLVVTTPKPKYLKFVSFSDQYD
ncbi:hypothetical protein RCL1_005973 [Eukaryota sp. TZLM3-RCL]